MAPALADTTVGQGVQPWNYTAINSTTAVVIKSTSGIFGGFLEASGSQQSAALTCYDNPSTASGTVVYAATLGPSQVVGIPWPGLVFTTGLVCQASGALNAPGVRVLWR